MLVALNFVFDLIVAILIYEYLKRDKKNEAYAAAVIIKVAFFLSSSIIMGEFNFIGLVIYALVMICVARLLIIIVDGIYKCKLHPVLFIFITTIIGIAIMSVLGEILYSLLFTLVSLFTATLHYSLNIISY